MAKLPNSTKSLKSFKVLDSKVTLLVVPGEKYHQAILHFLKKISSRKICYVTTNKGYSALVEDFTKKKLHLSHFFFLDCVTKTILEPRKEKNCWYLSSPRALTEISLAITKLMNFSEIIFFDSISPLLIYNNPEALRQFVHHLANQTRMNRELYLVLVISDKDKKTDLFRQIEPLVDKVLNL